MADVNQDGIPDLITGNDAKNGYMNIHIGNGTGNFTTATEYAAVGEYLAVDDFNGDGKPDIAASNLYDQDVTILLNQGKGAFHLAKTYNLGTVAYDVFAGDFHNDGRLDLALKRGGGIEILTGNGNGAFQDNLAQNFPAQELPLGAWLSSADFNGDGKVDLIAYGGSSGLHYLLRGMCC